MHAVEVDYNIVHIKYIVVFRYWIIFILSEHRPDSV